GPGVLHHPFVVPRHFELAEPRDHGNGRESAFERRGIEHWLECRPRLPLRVDGPVEGGLAEIASTHQGEHIARLRVESDEGRLQPWRAPTLEAGGYGTFGLLLYARDKRRFHFPV